jgi:sugar phosphate isomerase/epimerase
MALGSTGGMDRFSRRGFIGASAACLASPALAAPGKKPFFRAKGLPIGLQLFTVREEAAKDLDATLKAVAKTGYKTVECAGYAGRTPAEFRKALDAAGLKCTSAHLNARPLRPGPSLQDDLGKLAEEAHTIGFDTIIMPAIYFPDRYDLIPKNGEGLAEMVGRIGRELTAADYRFTADYLNKKAAALKKLGIKFGYHNHNLEFAPMDGTNGMEIMLKGTDPSLVSFEMDAGWVVAAGEDPIAWLKRYHHRFTAMHVKDVKATTKPNFAIQQDPAEVGSGIIDWTHLLPAAYNAGVRRFFVEQEAPFARPPLEAIGISYNYLNTLVAA